MTGSAVGITNHTNGLVVMMNTAIGTGINIESANTMTGYTGGILIRCGAGSASTALPSLPLAIGAVTVVP